MPPGPTLSPGAAPRRFPAGLLAAAVLAGFWLVLQASLWEKSATYDETVHAAAGCSYWRWGDYRLNPEAGNLPQRVAGLPLALGPYPLPSPDSAGWRAAREWEVADAWFHRLGNDFSGMLHRGRAACGLLAVALGALVWRTARRLFGPASGMLALMLYVLDPTILANGALMTSDTAAALFFLAAVLAVWSALGQLSAKRVALAGLAVGGLLVSKMSAFLILPSALLLGAARLARGGPLAVSAGAWRRELRSRRARAAALALAAVAGAAIAVSVVWGFYGFRYSAFAAGPRRARSFLGAGARGPAGPRHPAGLRRRATARAAPGSLRVRLRLRLEIFPLAGRLPQRRAQPDGMAGLLSLHLPGQDPAAGPRDSGAGGGRDRRPLAGAPAPGGDRAAEAGGGGRL